MNATRGKKASSSNGFVSSVWEFPNNVDVSYGAHSIFRWYGTLPGPLVGRLLDLYAEEPGATIWDPMCGSGTTNVECRTRGISVVGQDVNPLAVLVGQTKLNRIENVINRTEEYFKITHKALPRIESDKIKLFLQNKYLYSRKWFREDSLEQILRWGCAIGQNCSAPEIQRILLLALASTIREVAQVDSRCTHHLVTKIKDFIDPASLISSKALDIAAAIDAIPPIPNMAPNLIHQQSFEVPALSSCDLAIVHPPYLGVIHYNLIHRLSTDVLGFIKEATEPDLLSNLDFDSTRLKDSDASTDKDHRYYEFLDQLTEKLRLVVKPSGRAVIILGDSRHQGLLRHPFTRVIELMESKGFSLEENFVWLLVNNGGMHVLRRGHHIDHNYIMVFKESTK